MKKFRKFGLLIFSIAIFTSTVYAVTRKAQQGYICGHLNDYTFHHYVGYRIVEGNQAIIEETIPQWEDCYQLVIYYSWAVSYDYNLETHECRIFDTAFI